jgi:hypothetical protein
VEHGRGELARRLAGVDVTIAYPGVWIGPGVYAMHGHYLDCHLSVPRLESLCAAAMAAVVGDVPDRGARPGDYEAVLAPLYAFAYARAQEAGAANGSSRALVARLWRRAQRYGWARVLGGSGGGGRPTKALGGVAALAALGTLNRAGLGPFRADISPAAIGRAGVRAAGQVVTRLAIEADHVVLGHTHRAGPLSDDDDNDWSVPGGPALVNAGSWVYEPGLVGPAGTEDPYWPGRCVLVEDGRPPELRSLLGAELPATYAAA